MSTSRNQLFYDLNIISNWIYAEIGCRCNIYTLSVTTAKFYVCKLVEPQFKTACAPPSHYKSRDYGKQPTL